MITNNNYQELFYRDLMQDEKIVFDLIDKKITCHVKETYITCDDGSETKILIELRKRGLLNKTNKEYCTEQYGYKCKDLPEESTTWPDCKIGDYPALTRIVIDIFDKITNVYKVKVINLTDIGLVSFLK